ncbi:putative sterigmatocystin biosynthesis peroxidase stcC [Colletotrichum orbiculare MAFF 240422]|uniref:Sterigmatocystin biosynthesis peroxidase stcC n=1 Tax=Colletotrichum orbiculare (strain 104-T / ATCC 96160 / CBS 514.97 / LARS 414 / MAFF 240422) TaxID=1213857 RepID=N4UY67_COLOR|nr:putative sterigmatocystin biosynthesis peroxidase stcC [Colletotrichum orbiculare MAFF 240422]
MRVTPLSLAIFATAAVCQDAQHAWQAPGAGDRRSPCPLLNSLANHGYLPRHGQNISVDALIDGMHAGLNLREDAKLFFRLQGNKAVTASTTGVKDTFNLQDLNTHDLIEHDASLSRADTYFGDNWSFNQTIFDETKSHWVSETISIRDAAKALAARQKSAESINPEFNLPLDGHTNSLGQTAMYLGLFGDYDDGNANRAWVEYFFENERLPYELGWARRSDADKIPATGILALTTKVAVHYLAVKIGL